MADPRIARMASVLVRYSLNIQPGERLGIRGGWGTYPLLEAVARETIRAGGHPEFFFQPQNWQEILLREGSDEQIRRIPSGWEQAVTEFETLLDIQVQEFPLGAGAIDPQKRVLQRQAQGELLQTIIRRTNNNTLRWTLTLFPTQACAHNAPFSLQDFEDQFYQACFLEETDPVASWQCFSQQQEHYTSWLAGKSSIHIKGQDTDLTFSIQGRKFLNEDGHFNFPGGEFFTSPLEHSVNGSILYNLPSLYGGEEVSQAWLRFVDGRVVEAQAQRGQALLEQMLNLDEGARYLGEFAFGTNPFVQTSLRHILFDEKMEKTIHLALGASIPPTGGQNQSALHWDMVYDLRAGSEVYIDNVLFCKDGIFTI